jgi:cytosine deaminase
MPLITATDQDRQFMLIALGEARESFARGSVPVGAVMVRDGEVIASGRNRGEEMNDPTSHGETECIRNCGFLEDYGAVTLYTTVSPCMMCTGAILFLGIPRVVIGDREVYPGDVDFLLQRGLEVVLLDDPESTVLMRRFTTELPEIWSKVTSGSGTAA